MTKIVINTCYGGFHPSPKAIMRWAELSGLEMHIIIQKNRGNRTYDEPMIYKEVGLNEPKDGFFSNHYCTKPLNPDGTIPDDAYWYWGNDSEFEKKFRSDPIFIQVVEELGEEAYTYVSELKVVEIPDDIDWVIEDYDGVEWIAEVHRTWS